MPPEVWWYIGYGYLAYKENAMPDAYAIALYDTEEEAIAAKNNLEADKRESYLDHTILPFDVKQLGLSHRQPTHTRRH